ncbi:hypothetical protein O181_043216 [Austropuccinia psidii MF-1]|uniref:Uncharacterized protein n=1 Tax=Austropuccinia psidii MF-1 TaxID=1389203 RepID=A0A9Q3HFS6_9BASI|nr:hypothetical protein [Austropuccinia psidii MF-1]
MEITPDLEKEGPVESTCSITLQRQAEMSQKKQKQGEGKVDWYRPYPQGYWIPKLEPSAIDSVLNLETNLMEFTAKEQERMNTTFPEKWWIQVNISIPLLKLNLTTLINT